MADPKAPNPFAPKAGAKKVAAKAPNPFAAKAKTGAAQDPGQAVLSAGQTFLDVLSTPLYYIEGFVNGLQKGKNPAQTAAENAIAWTQTGKRPVTGAEILRDSGLVGAKGTGKPIEDGTPGAFIASLIADVALDPLTYTPGVLVSAPLKAISAGTRAAAKAAKLAEAGLVSEKIVTNVAKESAPKLLKPGSDIIQQYARKPIITQSMIRTEGPIAERLAKTEGTISNKFTYRTVEDATNVTPAKIAGSSIEAGAKAAAATFLLDFAKHDISKLLRAERKAGQTAAIAADHLGNPVELRPYDVHVADGAAHVFDGKKLRTFANEEDALAWSKSQTKTAEAAAPVITRGTRPVLDTAPSVTTKIVEGLPASNLTQKEAKGMLAKVDKIVAGLTGNGSVVVSAGQKLPLRTDIKSQFGYIATGELSPLDFLRKMRAVAKAEPRSQEAALAKHFGVISITGKTGQSVTLGELATSPTKFSQLSKETQNQISTVFNQFAQDPTVGRVTKAGTTAEKKYANYQQLVAGLKSGDQVDMAALTKIVKALDPEAKLITQIDKAASAETQYEQIAGILIGPGADTIYAVERRLQLVDAASLFEAQGLHLSEVAGAYAAGRIDGSIQRDVKATYESRESATANLAAAMENPDTRSATNAVFNAINKGLSGYVKKNGEQVTGQLGYIEKILASPDVVKGISNNGELAVRSTEKAYMADTKAALTQQANQYMESRILANLVSVLRSRVAKAGVEKGNTLNKVEASNLRKLTQQHMELVDDTLLSTLGARIVYSKAEIKGAKHFLFMSAADSLRIIGEMGGESVLDRALFSHPTDNFDFAGIANAIRMAVEAKATKVQLKDGELAAELLRLGNNRKWSPTFAAESKSLAAELEAIITDGKTIAKFEDAHNLKAMAAVEDAAGSAETLSLDTFTALLEGMKANFNKNIDSTAARAQLVRDWFYKLVYSTGVLEQQNGTIAAAMLEASAMIFVNDGRLAKLVAESDVAPSLIGSPTAKNALDREIFEQTKTAINSMFKNQADHVKIPKKLSDKITKDLSSTKQVYDSVIATLETKTTKAEIAKWARDVERAQLKLDAARKFAQSHNVETMHRYPDGTWVESNRYNHAAAVKMAKELRLDSKAVQDGIADVTNAVDSDTAHLVVSELSIKKSKEVLKQWVEEGRILSARAAATAREEAATKTLNKMDQIEQSGLTEGEQASYIIQDMTAEAMHSADIIVYHGATTYGKVPSAMVDGKQVVQQRGLFNRIGERISATSGRWTVTPLLARAESNTMQNFSNISDVMHHIRSEYLNYWVDPNVSKAANQAVRSQKFIEAFQLAKTKIDKVPAGVDPAVADLAIKIRQVIDPIFGDASNSAAKGIGAEALANAFRKFGLGGEMGFVSPGTLTEKQFADYLNWVPFGENPYKKGTIEFDSWEARANIFRNKGMDPFIVLSRMVQAVQFAKTEKAFVMDFAKQFGWQRHFTSIDQAVKAGWVKIEGHGPGGSNLAQQLPTPEQGGLFPPDIAEEFMSMNREWNNLYNGKAAPKFIRSIMEITGFFKATQTILRPGHHITNFVGDTTAAMIAGVLNPIHWKNGFDIAMKFAGNDAKATWGKNQLEFKFKQLFEGYKGYGRAFEGTDKAGLSIPQITIYGKGGGLKKLNLTQDELMAAFRERNILSGNIFQDHIQGLYESVTADAMATGAEQTALKAAAAKAQLALQKVEQPFGSFAAYYGNIIRASHALKVMQSRSWNSLDEALNAASTEVARYHPTIQSLSSSERKYPRLMFTYYTWLRVAHNALLDMAMNHTAAMMIPSKFQYQQAEQNGMQPTSFGNPWMDKTSSPNYLNYSVYGPTETGPNGPVIYKRSFLPLDVLDTWNFTWDPARTMDQNMFEMWNQGGRVIGKNINLVAQPAIEMLTGTDPATGKPSQVKDVPTFADKLIGNIGTVGLLKGIGAYTPVNKQPGTANPTTPEDQQRMLRNWITGQKETWVNTPSNVKNAQSEQTARANLIYEQYVKSQQGK